MFFLALGFLLHRGKQVGVKTGKIQITAEHGKSPEKTSWAVERGGEFYLNSDEQGYAVRSCDGQVGFILAVVQGGRLGRVRASTLCQPG
ncbi:hypothetical protein D3C84_874580 [compost metagenome]